MYELKFLLSFIKIRKCKQIKLFMIKFKNLKLNLSFLLWFNNDQKCVYL